MTDRCDTYTDGQTHRYLPYLHRISLRSPSNSTDLEAQTSCVFCLISQYVGYVPVHQWTFPWRIRHAWKTTPQRNLIICDRWLERIALWHFPEQREHVESSPFLKYFFHFRATSLCAVLPTSPRETGRSSTPAALRWWASSRRLRVCVFLLLTSAHLKFTSPKAHSGRKCLALGVH